MRSDAVIPGLVPAELVLVRTEQVAVAIGGVHACPNGFEFTVHARLRREDEPGPRVGGLFGDSAPAILRETCLPEGATRGAAAPPAQDDLTKVDNRM